MHVDLVKIMLAEAAHQNPAGGAPQQRLHGHSYQIEILAEGEVDPGIGWLVDYAELKHLFGPIYDQLDHGHLNEIPGLAEDTTLAGMERWIMDTVEASPGGKPPWLAGVRVSIVGDLAFAPVHLPADADRSLPPRLRFTFEAAQSLPQLPQAHPCHRVHGHSYRLEASAAALDALEPLLAKLYGVLDHQYLNGIEGLEKATCEQIARWVWVWLQANSAEPTFVCVQETPSARCEYRGG